MATALPVKTEEELRDAFWNQIGSFPEGDRIKTCLQCGTCTGTCPVSDVMDITPRKAIALFRAGMIEEVLKSRTIWICASCYSCTVRCPQDIRVTDTMYALKRIAMEKNIHPEGPSVQVLSRTFIKHIYKYGRNFELGLGAWYFLNSNPLKLLSNIGYGLALIRRGRLALLPHKLKRVNEVRKIIKAADKMGEH